MKFIYLILFFLAGCNTTMIDAANYDDFRWQSLIWIIALEYIKTISNIIFFRKNIQNLINI